MPADFWARLLQCPRCRQPLGADLTCTCGAVYPFDGSRGALIPTPTLSEGKQHIQEFWGDLCRQWYSDNDARLTHQELDTQLDTVERFFQHRRQLATVEMPADLSGKVVLEIGSGGGAHAALFKRRGAKLVAVDITPERVVSTSLKLGLVEEGAGVAFQADAESLPFVDGSFDIVYSNGVLHHSESTERCIDEVHRVLKPGGRAVLMLYSRHSAQYWLNILPRAVLNGTAFTLPEAESIGRITEGKPKFGHTRNPYTRVYSARELRSLLRKFTDLRLRKNSFRLDHLPIPRGAQLFEGLLRKLGVPVSPAGHILYGRAVTEETRLELALSPYLGFGWNISALKG